MRTGSARLSSPGGASASPPKGAETRALPSTQHVAEGHPARRVPAQHPRAHRWASWHAAPPSRHSLQLEFTVCSQSSLQPQAPGQTQNHPTASGAVITPSLHALCVPSKEYNGAGGTKSEWKIAWRTSKGQEGEQMSVRWGSWVEKPLPTSWKLLELSPDLEPPGKGVVLGLGSCRRRQDHSEIQNGSSVSGLQEYPKFPE